MAMLEVEQPKNLRRASLISEIYSETHTFANVPGRGKPKFSAITSVSDGKRRDTNHIILHSTQYVTPIYVICAKFCIL